MKLKTDKSKMSSTDIYYFTAEIKSKQIYYMAMTALHFEYVKKKDNHDMLFEKKTTE